MGASRLFREHAFRHASMGIVQRTSNQGMILQHATTSCGPYWCVMTVAWADLKVKFSIHRYHFQFLALQERVCRQGLQGELSEITLTQDAYQTVLLHCPASGPILLEALNMVIAMSYFPSASDMQPLLLSAIVACVMEARAA